ncbi:UNVERIFIED_CONTAM: hypothetical protein QE602_11830, partial [Streptococcus suis]
EPTSYLTGFESPLDSGRSVVVLAGGDASGLQQILDAMASKDPEAETIQGSLVAVRGTTIDPLLASVSTVLIVLTLVLMALLERFYGLDRILSGKTS